ncbi:response regulator [Pseudoalteromonas sp. 2CM32C]|nr:response regulator [Pseudoalteromonas sp. 2CM32C]MCK8121078.1 response regulator [Pseudoalteromonas sp. 2CM32C]
MHKKTIKTQHKRRILGYFFAEITNYFYSKTEGYVLILYSEDCMPIPVTIADDSALSRKTIKRALPEDWDITIHEAKNGVEALDAVHAGLAEVLFLDLQMPQKDGFEVLKELQQEHQKTIVIVISADIQPAAQALVSSMGAFRFLQKPLKADQLRETLLDVGLL